MKCNQLLKSSVYQQLLLERAIDSKVSFNSIETPGWSSMVRTERGSRPLSNRGDLNNGENGLMFNGKDMTNQMNAKQKQKKQRLSDVRVYQNNQNKPPEGISTDRLGINKSEKQPKMRLSERVELKTNNECISESESADSIVYNEYPKEEPKVYRMGKQRMILIHKENQKQQKKQSRFKQITVYEHLYQSFRKMESRKALEAILEQKYVNEHTTTFKPSIDANSVKIAERKFAGNGTSEAKKFNSVLINKISTKQSNESQINEKRGQLFKYLSGSSDVINQSTVSEIIKEMPMSCLRFLQKLLQKIFCGQSYTQTQFNKVLNQKKIVINKQRLLNSFDKWYSGKQILSQRN